LELRRPPPSASDAFRELLRVRLSIVVETPAVAMSSGPMALRSGRKLSVVRLPGRYGHGEVDTLGMDYDEAAVKLAHSVVESGRPAGAEAHGLIEIADPVGTV
jgi:hypothetical protein